MVGGETIQGIISNIGDVDFQTLTNKSESIKFLKEYKPENQYLEVEKQKELLKLGIESNGYKYSNSSLAKLNSTYILRSIAYDFYPPKGLFPGTSKQFDASNLDNRTDITVAFRVVG